MSAMGIAGAGAAVMASLTPMAAYGVTISTVIPGGSPYSPAQIGIGAYVGNFYAFALWAGGILAFAIVVFGGIKYMVSMGNPSNQEDAKEWIKSALLGLLLLAGAYFILNLVNPQLTTLTPPALAPVNVQQAVQAYTNSATCTAPSAGPCTAASLANTCLGSNAANAARICSAESSGIANAPGDLTTSKQPASVGLFQINLSANTIPAHCTPGSAGCLNCPAAFDHSWHAPGKCGSDGCGPSTIKSDSASQALYAQCVAAAENIQTNIQEACQLSSNGTNWNAWSTHTSCGL